MKILNFGCGAQASDDCLNIDGSFTVLLAKLPVPPGWFGSRADFVKAIRQYQVKFGTARYLRLPQNSLDAFYSSHTLEHLTPQCCESLLNRVKEWLKPGGVLRVVLPDLKQLAESYVAGNVNADQFVEQTGLAHRQESSWNAPFSHSEHLWMYDSNSFIGLLQKLEYREILNSTCARSRIPELGKLDLTGRDHASFYIEALK